MNREFLFCTPPVGFGCISFTLVSSLLELIARRVFIKALNYRVQYAFSNIKGDKLAQLPFPPESLDGNGDSNLVSNKLN